MDLWDLLRVLVRRWWVTVPLLVLTAVAATTLGGRETTTFDGRADYVLVPPGNDDAAAGPIVNPLASINSTGPFGGLIGTVVGSSETRDEVQQAGGERGYQLTQGRNSPTLVVSVESDSADVAQLTVREVLTRVDQQIVALQDQFAVPAQFRIRGQLVVGPLVTSTISSSNRVLLGVGAAGLLLTALAALAAEALLSTRRRRPVVPARTGGVRSLMSPDTVRLPQRGTAHDDRTAPDGSGLDALEPDTGPTGPEPPFEATGSGSESHDSDSRHAHDPRRLDRPAAGLADHSPSGSDHARPESSRPGATSHGPVRPGAGAESRLTGSGATARDGSPVGVPGRTPRRTLWSRSNR